MAQQKVHEINVVLLPIWTVHICRLAILLLYFVQEFARECRFWAICKYPKINRHTSTGTTLWYLKLKVDLTIYFFSEKEFLAFPRPLHSSVILSSNVFSWNQFWVWFFSKWSIWRNFCKSNMRDKWNHYNCAAKVHRIHHKCILSKFWS